MKQLVNSPKLDFWSLYSSIKIFKNKKNLLGYVSGNPDAKRLYDDLLSNYNKLVRPVVNVTDAVMVRLKLKLSQLIDVVSKANCTYFLLPKKW